MKFSRKFLWPLVPFYYLGSLTIKKLYDWGIYKSQSYDFPIICVGNLSVGGTGKSPFVSYLIELLQKDKQLATLSRGYKRSTKDFQLATANSTALEIGDEPLQFKVTHPKTIVAVDANRKNGINQLLTHKPAPEIIILDDAFQHRKVQAGFQILLTAYYNRYTNDCMLPAGDLREPISAAARATIIIVTKCPLDLSNSAQQKIKKQLRPLAHQKVYFTGITYAEDIYGTHTKIKLTHFLQDSFCLVTGIAEPAPLVSHLKNLDAKFTHLNFPDHHVFSQKELDKISTHKRVLTTQKDFMRLQHVTALKNKLFYLPISIQFLNTEEDFKQQVFDFISD